MSALTPMGKRVNRVNSDKIKQWSIDNLLDRKLVKSALFCVLTVDSEWIQKGYINSSSSIEFDNEHEAIEYIDRWYQTHKGYCKILTPSN